jgi:hypothetical protein
MEEGGRGGMEHRKGTGEIGGAAQSKGRRDMLYIRACLLSVSFTHRFLVNN